MTFLQNRPNSSYKAFFKLDFSVNLYDFSIFRQKSVQIIEDSSKCAQLRIVWGIPSENMKDL